MEWFKDKFTEDAFDGIKENVILAKKTIVHNKNVHTTQLRQIGWGPMGQQTKEGTNSNDKKYKEDKDILANAYPSSSSFRNRLKRTSGPATSSAIFASNDLESPGTKNSDLHRKSESYVE